MSLRGVIGKGPAKAPSLLYGNTGQAAVGIIAILFFAVSLLLLTFLGIPLGTSALVVTGCLVFFISFINIDLALIILIFSMLLSPEFYTGAVPGRAVKVRADDIFLLIVFFGWLAKMAINKELGLFRTTKLNAPIMAYIVVCFFSAFLGVIQDRANIKTALFYLIKYIEYFLLFFMVANNMKTIKQAKRFIFFILLTCIIVCFYAGIHGADRFSAPFESGSGGEPNTLAGYLILMISLMIGMIMYPESARQRIVLVGLLAIAGMAFLYTLSRSGWLSFFPVVMAFILFGKKYKAQLVIVVVIIAVVLPIIAPQKVHERVKETFTPWKKYEILGKKIGIDESTEARINSWRVGVWQWSFSPIFGYGIPSGSVIDNHYMRVLNESGIIGFTVFMWMLFTIFRVARETFDTAGEEPFKRAVSLGLLAGFMGLLLLSAAASVFIVIRIMEPFWFLVAIVATLPELTEEEEAVPAL